MRQLGSFFGLLLHEVGHATFDILKVPIFGHEEDAADNFATYIMLQFGEGQAHRLIAGAAWAWRAYLGDYKKILSCHCGSAHLAAIMVSLKSVSTISHVWHMAPTAWASLTLRIICRQRGRQAACSNTGPWSGPLKRKSRHISIRKSPGGCWIQIGFNGWNRNQFPRNSPARFGELSDFSRSECFWHECEKPDYPHSEASDRYVTHLYCAFPSGIL